MLFKHQQKFLDENPDKTALIWSCGTGKTRAAIEWANLNLSNALVICPKALKTNWENEIRNHSVREALVMTKEEFRADFKSIQKFDQIIVDEVHMGFLTPLWKSQMSKALKKYIEMHKVPRVLLLSATPYTSSPWNVFNLAYLLGHRWNWQKFRIEFFYDVRMGARIVPMPKKGCEKKLASLIKKIANVVDISECIDVPEQTFENEYFQINPIQKKYIQEAYDPLPIVRFTRIHQIENGIFPDSENPFNFSYDKLDRLKTLVDENKKVIIVCRYNLQIDSLIKEFKGKKIFVIRGDVKDRDTVVRAADKSDEAIVLIQAACSAGYELPSFRIMVFASMDYSFVNFKQICGRILRINNPQKNLYIRLIGGEIDQAISDAIDNKQDFNIELYEK